MTCIVYLVIPNIQYQVSSINEQLTDRMTYRISPVAKEIQCSGSHGHDPKGKPFWGHEDTAFWSNPDDEIAVKHYEGIEFWLWSVLAAIRKHVHMVCTPGMHCSQFWRLKNPWRKWEQNWYLLQASSLPHTGYLQDVQLHTSDLSTWGWWGKIASFRSAWTKGETVFLGHSLKINIFR